MTIRQAYYTSCEEGLSGFAGFQFNAATPGIPVSAMRYIETITAYEPPSSVGFEPTETTVAECPAALMYAVDEATVIANVVFTGADFTNRFGNYFAHALVSDGEGDDFGAVLPIELWQTPLWVKKETKTRELPVLDEPIPRGTINRAAIEKYLAGHRFADHAAALLSAAARSVCEQQRSLVIIDDSDDAIARWIALVSYLLPESMTRTMSFTTFHNKPAYCPLRVVGTLPTGDIDRSEAAFDSHYYLFDFTTGRASAVDVHPLARILVERGPTRIEALWQKANDLARGDERGLDDWYPVVLASVDGDVRTSTAQSDLVIDWLVTDAARLGPQRLSLAAGPLAARQITESQFARIAQAGRSAGAGSVVEDAEVKLVDRVLDRLLAGDQSGVAPLSTSQARQYAAERCAAALNSDPSRALDILRWAATDRLPVDGPTLATAGRRWVGPALFNPSETTDVQQLPAASPAILSGVIAYLEARCSSDPVSVSQLLTRQVGGLIEAAPLEKAPTLHTLVLHEIARRDPRRRVEALDGILSLKETAAEVVSDTWLRDTLTRLWVGEPWTSLEAEQAIAVLSDEQMTAPAVLQRLNATLLAEVPMNDTYVSLCRALRRSPALEALTANAAACVVTAEEANERIRSLAPDGDGAELARISRDLRSTLGASAGPVRRALLSALLAAMEHLSGPHLAEMVGGATDDMNDAFRHRLLKRFDPSSPSIELAARVLHAQSIMDARDVPYRMDLENVVNATLPRWRRRDSNALSKQLSALDPVLATRFGIWQEMHQAAQSGGLFRRRREKF